MERQASKGSRESRGGSPSLGPVERPLPLLPPRDASSVSIGKDGYQKNDEDDPEPGRHSDPFLGSGPTLRGMDGRRRGRTLGIAGAGARPPFVWAWLPREGKTSLKGTPCRNKLASRKTPTPQSVLRSSLTTGSTRSGPGGGVEPSDASNASVSGGFGFGVDLVLAVPADEAAAIA
jgi:hypothetical protein